MRRPVFSAVVALFAGWLAGGGAAPAHAVCQSSGIGTLVVSVVVPPSETGRPKGFATIVAAAVQNADGSVAVCNPTASWTDDAGETHSATLPGCATFADVTVAGQTLLSFYPITPCLSCPFQIAFLPITPC